VLFRSQDALRNFGAYLGISFQIRDDILNLAGTPGKYSKQIGEDIRESKRTLIISYLLSHLGEEKKKRLASTLRKPEKSEEDISRVISLAHEYGAIEYAESVASRFAKESTRELSALKNKGGAELLSSISQYISKREF
jgi:geranylgeranyl pyrophosphate synthase